MNQGDGAALPILTKGEQQDYEEIARKYEAVNDFDNAEKYYKLANTPSARQALEALFARVTEATFSESPSPPDSPLMYPSTPKPQLYIRLTRFDKETNQPVSHEVYPDDRTKGNINVRAYWLRAQFADAQVEVVPCPDGVPPLPRTEPIPRSRYIEEKIHDWIVVALTKLTAGARLQMHKFKSTGNLPIKSTRLRAVLERVLKHPLYRGQQMHFLTADGVCLRVEGGRITEDCPGGKLHRLSETDDEEQLDEEELGPETEDLDIALRQFPRRKMSLPRLPNVDSTERHRGSVKTRAKRRHRRRSVSHVSNLELTSSMEEEDEEDENSNELSDTSPEGLQSPETTTTQRQKFSTAVTTIYHRQNLNVLELPEQPRSLDELFVNAAKVIQESEQHSNESSDEHNENDEDCLCTYTRVFTATGRELLSINDVIAYCVPHTNNTTQGWGLTTIVFSMGEDFC